MDTPDLSPYYKVVEDAIQQLGIDPALCRGEKGGQWNLKKNDVNVWIDLWYIEREQRPYYQVMAPILQLPADNREKLYEELLQINDSLYGVAFTLYKDWVYLKVIREVEGMDDKEAFAMLTRIGNYADVYKQDLHDKYTKDDFQNRNLRGGQAPA